MRVLGLICATVAALALAASAASTASASGSYVLTATSSTPASGYAPTFTGNGWLGIRVPPTGQGYAGGKNVPTQSELAGFYAKPTKPTTPADAIQQRANIPTWSTLTFTDGGIPFSLKSGTTTGWRQSIDLHTGIIATSATWKAPDGHTTKLAYQVLTDRANAHVGIVTLALTPSWSGTAAVTDEVDGAPATLTDQVTKGSDPTQHQDYVEVRAQTTGIDAAIASRLATSANITAAPTEVRATPTQTIGQQVTFPVVAGQTYTLTKYVGVDDSQDTSDPIAGAQSAAAGAAAAGYGATLAANDAAWAALWRGRIDVLGDSTLATDVDASEFYLWSSTRDGVDWSISPAGLSSNGYNGHIFWDAETWMYPSLLAQHPDLAAGMNAYRFDRLAAAQQHAAATGYRGARFPWESALDGTEQIPPPVSVNSEGVYEVHITADIALAQWQYYLATGDTSWLATRGWPVISGAAAFWASRARPGADGSYHIDHVTGPDEENPNVNDEVYTNVAAKTTLQDAVSAAKTIGAVAPASWSRIARGLTAPVSAGHHPEFSGYRSQLVKQADVTLLQYPWQYPMSASVAAGDLNFYVPRSDPTGPSMTDAVNEIDTSRLGTAGCSSFVYTERSYQPFIRDVFHQFSETRTGGAFTFMTGIGGFLQEFLYGYSGLRWEPGAPRLDPSLGGGMTGIVLHDLSWRSRTFDVTIGTRRTAVALVSGAPMPVTTPSGTRTVTRGHSLILATARPDLRRTPDAVRCLGATATSAQPGAPALAAVDGSPATDWAPAKLPATITTPTRPGARPIRRIVVTWGQVWPPVVKPNVHPKPTPVRTVAPRSYAIQVSSNGRSWRTVATVNRRTTQTTDVFRFGAMRAAMVRLRITKGTGLTVSSGTGTSKMTSVAMPQLQELTVSR